MARFGDALTTGADLVNAAERAVLQALEQVDGPADLVCFFVSGEDPEEVTLAGTRVMELSGGAVTLGCSATGVIGGGRGVEGQGAVSVWCARLPGVELTPFWLDTMVEGDHLAVVGMREPSPNDRVGILLTNPYEFPTQAFVRETTAALGGLPLVGGMADGLRGEGSVRLFCEGEVALNGAVGVLVGGDGVLGTVVSQGCRPIGPNMTVTKAEGNLVMELAGVNAYERLESLVERLSDEDRELAEQGLHLGIAVDEYADHHEQGDFLIRSLVSADEELGALTIGDMVEVGQTVRFQVHDADTADEDLARRLAEFGAEHAVGAGLLFSGDGRGASLFPRADHDVLSVRRTLGAAPVAGFFAAGEIGPVSGANHVQGFTACLLAFAP
ncbi:MULTISPECIES: FIST signal transduction protein [Nocardiopsis]|uniref:FIST N-terminal domain-containing protein n=1 Tax=Nocardiopsis alba TaxID=53437 RepID=A0A7K2IUP1_9ACTN|nr:MULTISPECIES: FIST N-terminal domain-containing protein [Nocardiopsis]MEC3895216.1 FIST N-terminal domain-containing protein [Nocardiopsis sp. LDBS1602]MYR33671.1 histidine kinase [Nocardiopsis alba]